MGFPGGSAAKNLPAMLEMLVQSLGKEDLLGKEMAIHSSILVWEIPWIEEPVRLQSMGEPVSPGPNMGQPARAQATASIRARPQLCLSPQGGSAFWDQPRGAT